MEPRIGWTLLSREALRRAENHLNEDIQGVRDEIGFLALHQAYADRFFPGTSVQHTRLRYFLFVPWLYMQLAEQKVGRHIDEMLQHAEIKTTGRLKEADEAGIIGTRSYPDPTSQPPSLVYWSALGAWRILRPMRDGTHLTRSTLHRIISQSSPAGRIKDDDKMLLEEQEHVFSSVPSPPKVWADSSKSLSFDLTKSERRFMEGVIIALSRTEESGQSVPALISRLVEKKVGISKTTSMWSSKILSAADSNDRNALKRSEKVAHLSAIGRAVYAALVEQTLEKQDGTKLQPIHRPALTEAIEMFRESALSLNLDEIALDTNAPLQNILQVLRETQNWLRSRKSDISELYSVYCETEKARKGKRARLPLTLLGREKRAEWFADKQNRQPQHNPLHYRWGNVRSFLIDLGGNQ